MAITSPVVAMQQTSRDLINKSRRHCINAIMEAAKQSSNSENGDQGESRRVDQVLIEKDGKFELVNSSDMQALTMRMDSSDEHLGAKNDQEHSQHTSGEQSVSMEEPEDYNQNLKEKDPMIVDNGNGVHDHQGLVSQSHGESDIGEPPIEVEDHTQTNNPDESEQKENLHSNSRVTGINKQFTSPSQVSFVVSEEKKIVASSFPTRLAPGDIDSLQTSSTTTLSRSNNRKLLISRSKSAPGFRNPNKRNQEEDLQRRERNEAAFRAWLARKDKQLAYQRQSESVRIKKSEEEIREKQRRNEAAYQAWLKSKTQEYLEQRTKERIIRPVTSISKDDEERRRVAFESWLARKQGVKQIEEDNKQKSRQLEEEAATKADPTIVAQAYKRSTNNTIKIHKL